MPPSFIPSGRSAVPEIVFRSPPLAGAVDEARHVVERGMRAWSLLSIEEPATAITAELVANAVRHARSDLELRLIHRGPRIRIEVSDNDPSLPILTRPSGLQVGGRGMLIVDQYATDWGTTRTPGGKTVWADIDLTADDLPWRPGGL